MPSYEKRNDKWSVRFRLDGKNKRLSGYYTKRGAEQAYIKAKTVVNKASSDMTLEILFELFKDYKKLRQKESTFMSFVQTIRDYVLPHFAKKKITDITPAQIIDWQTTIDKLPIKFRTKERIFATFISLMNYAVDFYNMPINPVSKAGNFKNNELKPDMKFWTEKEFEQFISVIKDLTYKAFFSTLYLTGARKGEAMALTWHDINFTTDTISITKSYTDKVFGGGYKITTPKTKSSIRQVLAPRNLIDILQRLQAEHQQYEGYTDKCFVFGFSRPLPTTTVTRKKQEYCKLANVKEIRIHDFRHSHASLLINKEQNILLVAQRLGHSDINQTLNTYSHLFPNKQKELMSSLNIKLE